MIILRPECQFFDGPQTHRSCLLPGRQLPSYCGPDQVCTGASRPVCLMAALSLRCRSMKLFSLFSGFFLSFWRKHLHRSSDFVESRKVIARSDLQVRERNPPIFCCQITAKLVNRDVVPEPAQFSTSAASSVFTGPIRFSPDGVAQRWR